MFKKVGISLMAALMLSSVAFAGDFTPADDGDNKQECKQEERKMITFDKDVVKKILMEDNGYSDFDASIMINAVSEFDSKLQPILDSYVANRSLYADFNVEGVTIEIVMDKLGCDFWNALTDLDFYLRNPDDAKRLLKREPRRYIRY